ncbi:MAG: DUF4856 domain-containing protein [Bacteroidia bacterium]
MQKTTLLLISLAFILGITSCKEDVPPLVIPDNYDASGFAASTTTQATVRTQLGSMSSLMKTGRIAGVFVTEADLVGAFNAGNPSLSDISTSYYGDRIRRDNGWIENLSFASANMYTPGTPQNEGGFFEGYLFDENGIELEQIIEKGLFAAAMYNHALTLMNGDLADGTTDQIISIFGAHPDFANSNNSDLHNNPDVFMANYTARRDKNDGDGFYTNIQKASIKLQAAIAAGDDYKEDQQEAIDAIKDNWEKASAATVINYCHAAISKLSATNPTESDQASALHAYSEAVGFLHGWYEIPAADKRISDSEIEEVLALMNAPQNGTPTSYTFVTDPVNQLPQLTDAINRLKAIYAFSDQQIEDFKSNWVSEQNR